VHYGIARSLSSLEYLTFLRLRWCAEHSAYVSLYLLLSSVTIGCCKNITAMRCTSHTRRHVLSDFASGLPPASCTRTESFVTIARFLLVLSPVDRSACLPRGVCSVRICCASGPTSHPVISKSTAQIFTKFLVLVDVLEGFD